MARRYEARCTSHRSVAFDYYPASDPVAGDAAGAAPGFIRYRGLDRHLRLLRAGACPLCRVTALRDDASCPCCGGTWKLQEHTHPPCLFIAGPVDRMTVTIHPDDGGGPDPVAAPAEPAAEPGRAFDPRAWGMDR